MACKPNVIYMRKRGSGAWCGAANCTSSKRKFPFLTFFRFPRDPERCKRWVINSGRQDLIMKKPEEVRSRVLCAKHFKDDQFMNAAEKNRLIHCAVPTLFAVVKKPNPLMPSKPPPKTRSYISNRKKDRKGERDSSGNLPQIYIDNAETAVADSDVQNLNIPDANIKEEIMEMETENWLHSVEKDTGTSSISQHHSSLSHSPVLKGHRASQDHLKHLEAKLSRIAHRIEWENRSDVRDSAISGQESATAADIKSEPGQEIIPTVDIKQEVEDYEYQEQKDQDGNSKTSNNWTSHSRKGGPTFDEASSVAWETVRKGESSDPVMQIRQTNLLIPSWDQKVKMEDNT